MQDRPIREDQAPVEGTGGVGESPRGRGSEGVIGRDLDQIDRPMGRGEGATGHDEGPARGEPAGKHGGESPGRPEEHPNRP